MGVLPSKTVASCKLCKHDRRSEIDELLLKRSLKTRDPVTKQLTHTADIIRQLLADDFGVENPTLENLAVHWKKHCQVVTDAEVADVAKALDEHQEELLAIVDGSDGTVDSNLRVIHRLSMARIRGRILRGEDPGVSVDQGLKAVGELTKRQDNEAKHELLSALTGGIVDSIAAGRQPKQIEAGEVEIIDAEVVEA